MKWFRGKEKGMTLIELLVVIPIMGLIGAAAASVIVQILHSGGISADTLAIRQVQMAGDRVSEDGIQSPAYNITIADNITDAGGFLHMRWNSYWTDNNSVYHNSASQLTYTIRLAPSGDWWRLERHQVTVTDGNTQDSTILAAEYLDASQMTCTWDPGGRSFTFIVVATVASETQSREYKIQPRVVT